ESDRDHLEEPPRPVVEFSPPLNKSIWSITTVWSASLMDCAPRHAMFSPVMVCLRKGRACNTRSKSLPALPPDPNQRRCRVRPRRERAHQGLRGHRLGQSPSGRRGQVWLRTSHWLTRELQALRLPPY